MAKQVINHGTTPGDGMGETLFSAFKKVNDNFTEVYEHAHTGTYQPADVQLDEWAGIDPDASIAVFLATPSSANLRTAVTDETGSGALVFGTDPTFTLTAKTTPVDADTVLITDSAASAVTKKVTWANIKTALETWLNSLTATWLNKTLTTPVLTTPKINDASANNTYNVAVSELTADRTVTLPLLTGNDTVVFEAHTQTLTNKTAQALVLTGGVTTTDNSSLNLGTGAVTCGGLTASGNVILGDASTDTLNVGNGGLIKDVAGNLGLGVTPSAWTLGKAIEVGVVGNALWSVSSGNFNILSNAYHNSSSYRYATTAAAAGYQIASGQHIWSTAPSGTAGNAITFTQAMTLDASGNLGVGEASSGDRLHVKGYATRVLHVENGTNTSGYNAAYFSIGSNGNSTSTYFLQCNTSGVGNWYLYGNGTMSFTSDSRQKKNIETARSGYLDDIMNLRVVKYRWFNQDPETPQELGLIAQEVEQVFPHLVQEHELEGVGMRKVIKTSVLPMIMLKAIQELSAKNEALESRLAALENK